MQEVQARIKQRSLHGAVLSSPVFGFLIVACAEARARTCFNTVSDATNTGSAELHSRTQLRIPPDVGHRFRRMPAPDSAPSRLGIPRHVGPLLLR
jgi:hypothetical protein